MEIILFIFGFICGVWAFLGAHREEPDENGDIDRPM